MKSHTLLVLSSALCLYSVSAKTDASVRQDTAHTDDLDSFEIWKAFPEGIAIMDSGKKMSLECVQATRTKLSRKSKSATYDYTFPSNGETIPFYMTAGATPGSATFTVGDDSTVRKAQFYYTDYKNCAVETLDYDGAECVLWVRSHVIKSIPQACIDHYQQSCGATISSDPKC